MDLLHKLINGQKDLLNSIANQNIITSNNQQNMQPERRWRKLNQGAHRLSTKKQDYRAIFPQIIIQDILAQLQDSIDSVFIILSSPEGEILDKFLLHPNIGQIQGESNYRINMAPWALCLILTKQLKPLTPTHVTLDHNHKYHSQDMNFVLYFWAGDKTYKWKAMHEFMLSHP